MKTGEKVSDQLERWLCGEEPKTLGSLIELFGEKSFAAVFVLLLAIPALPLPTGGATHILEAIAMLLALELMAGRRELWLPQRWRQFQLAGASQGRFSNVLLARIRWLERFSRPRLSRLLNHRVSGVVFGTIVFAMTAAGVSGTSLHRPGHVALDGRGRAEPRRVAGGLHSGHRWGARWSLGCGGRDRSRQARSRGIAASALNVDLKVRRRCYPRRRSYTACLRLLALAASRSIGIIARIAVPRSCAE